MRNYRAGNRLLGQPGLVGQSHPEDRFTFTRRIAHAFLYLVNQFVPMAAPIKTIINVVVVLVVVVWLLNAFGLLDSGQRIRFRN